MDTERVRPRWCGQDRSEMWDSGLGRTPSTFRPTSPQSAGRKRRVGDRLASGPGIGMPVSNKRALWGTPRKRAFFGSDGQNSVSSESDVPEGGYSEVAQSSRSPQNDDRTGTQSWRNFGWSPDMAAPEDGQLWFRPLTGLGLHRRHCPGMQEGRVGTSIAMFLKL